MNWEECRDLLKEAHEEQIAPAHYAAVRSRVLDELARRERPLWAHRWLWAAAATACALLVGVQVDLRPQIEPPAVALAYPPAPVVSKAVRKYAATRVAVRRAPVAKAKTEPLMIRIVTDDPDVVLYWIAESKGDE